MKPLFIWAGGKNKMLKKYAQYLPETFDTYIEPFLGGGAMFIWAFEKNPNAKFYLNDICEPLINVYSSIRNNFDEFTKKLDIISNEYLSFYKIEARKNFYYSLRYEHAYDYMKWNKAEEAAVLYFLMKTSFNGVWQINKNTNDRFGTPCGLLNQKNNVYDKDNLIMWHNALQKCVLTSIDFTETLKYIDSKCYIFLDPPYRGCFTNYNTQSDDDFQDNVIQYMKSASKTNAYILLSNRDLGDMFFENRRNDFKLVHFDVTYTAGRRKKSKDGTFTAKRAREILLISD